MPKLPLPTKSPLEYSYGERFAQEAQKSSSIIMSKLLLSSCLLGIILLTLISLSLS